MAVLLVTGANRGIGLKHVRQALAAGESMIATCRASGKADQLRKLSVQYPDRLRIAPLDIADAASVDALSQSLDGQPIDMLINNAGLYGGSWETGGHRQTAANMGYALWEKIMRINALGAFGTTMALLPNIAASDRKIIVMMSSDLGSIANNDMGQSHAYRSIWPTAGARSFPSRPAGRRQNMVVSLGQRMKFAVVAPSTNTRVGPGYAAMQPHGLENAQRADRVGALFQRDQQLHLHHARKLHDGPVPRCADRRFGRAV